MLKEAGQKLPRVVANLSRGLRIRYLEALEVRVLSGKTLRNVISGAGVEQREKGSEERLESTLRVDISLKLGRIRFERVGKYLRSHTDC